MAFVKYFDTSVIFRYLMLDKSDNARYRILVNLSHIQISELDRMVESGLYPSRSEAIREAVNLLLETKKLEQLKEKLG